MSKFFTLPIEEVIARHCGPSQPRYGDRSPRLWWVCPFHEDSNPSLCAEPGANRFHCFGCGTNGDAIDFVRRLNPSLSFKEAVAAAGGELAPSRDYRPPTPKPRPQPTPTPRPDGWQEFARGLVDRAEALLWSPRGVMARDYLHGRGLSEATIRAARLGLQAADVFVGGVFPGAKVSLPRGIVIPWFEGADVALVNIRRPVDEPKYWAIRGSRRGGIYPSASAIRTGKPLVLAEGEMDTLLLAQELAGLASVVTLGTAGDRPSPANLGAMVGATPWFVSGDSDAAGEKSSGGWLATSKRCRRLRSPAGKDWTEAHQAGVGLRDWWVEALRGIETLPGPVAEGGSKSSAAPVEEPDWSPPPWFVLAFWDFLLDRLEAFAERGAIMEFDGGLEHDEAQRRAFIEVFGGGETSIDT